MGPTELWGIIVSFLGNVAKDWIEPPPPRGGKVYSVWHVVAIHLVCLFRGWSSNVLYQKLVRPGFRREHRMPNQFISHSQFKKRRKGPDFHQALLGAFKKSASQALERLGNDEVKIVAADLTRIESNPCRDSMGAWGWDSKGCFYGYKLGLIISRGGILLGFGLMKANWTEFKITGRLLRLAKEVIRPEEGQTYEVSYLVCDSGFDSEGTHRKAAEHLDAVTLCPPKRERNPKAKNAKRILARAKRRTPLRFEAEKIRCSDVGKEIYRERIQIERVNGQIKDSPIRISELPRSRRGVRRLLPIILGKLIIYNLALYANILEGREMRRIKHLVA